MARPFLTAQWRNLFLATYAVPASLLERRLPPGLELDLYDGSPCVSLVAFQFLDTRVLGIPWPGYRNFAELNLRFYVRRGEERGVVFIREFVPQRLVAWIARFLYNEPYLAAPISVAVQEYADAISVDWSLKFAGREQRIHVTGALPTVMPGCDSSEHFFKEHSWGYGVTRGGKLLRYQVEHPMWEVYPVREYQLDFNFAAVYGAEWGLLNRATPISTVLAVGSPVRVFPKGKL